jgi:hypothetical protein
VVPGASRQALEQLSLREHLRAEVERIRPTAMIAVPVSIAPDGTIIANVMIAEVPGEP